MRWNNTMRILVILLGALVASEGFAQNRLPIRSILLHFKPSDMAFQSDGRHLILMRDQALAIYDTAADRVSRVFGPKDFEQGDGLSLNMFAGTNGDLVALEGIRNQTRIVAVYIINTKRLVSVIEAPANSFVSLSPSGNWIALRHRVSNTETILRLVNLPQQRVYSYRYLDLYRPFQNVGLDYPKVLFTSDDQRAVVVTALASSAPPKAELIRLADGAVESEILFGNYDTLPHSLQLAPSGRYLAVYGWNRTATTASGIFVVDLQDSTVQNLRGATDLIYNFPTGLAWVSDQMLLVGRDSGFAVYTRGTFQRYISVGGYPQLLVVHPRMNRVAVTHYTATCLVDWENLSAQVYPYASPEKWTFYADACFSRNRAWMAVPGRPAGTDWYLSLHRTNDFSETRRLLLNTRVRPLAVSDDGQRVVVSSSSGTSTQTHLLDTTTGQMIWSLPYGTSQALFLPDGSGVLLYARSHLIRIQNDGSEAWRRDVSQLYLDTLISVSGDGTLIATSFLREVLSIDLETLEVRVLYRSRDPMQVATTPDHQYIAILQPLLERRVVTVFRFPTMQQVGIVLLENETERQSGYISIAPVLLDSAGLSNEFHAYTQDVVYIISAETARLTRRVPLQDAYAYNRGFWRTSNGWATLRRDSRYIDAYDMVHHPAHEGSQRIVPISYRAFSPQFTDTNEVVFKGGFGGVEFGGIMWQVKAQPSEFHRFVTTATTSRLGLLVVGGGYFLSILGAGTWLAGEWPSLAILDRGTVSLAHPIENRPDLVVLDTQLYNWMTRTTLWDVNDTGLSGISSFLFSPDARLCLIRLSSEDRCMYDVQENRLLWRRELIERTTTFSRDSRYLLVNGVALLNARTGNPVTNLRDVVYLDGRFALTHAQLENNHTLTSMIEIPSRRTIATFETPQPCERPQVAASPDDRWFIITNPNYSLIYPHPYSRTAGDTNFDGCVDDADLEAVLFRFGSSGGWEDLNGDGVVDDADLLLVVFHFGNGC